MQQHCLVCLSGYDYISLNAYYTACCFSDGVTVRSRIRFSVWLVSGYAHVLILPSVVIVGYAPNLRPSPDQEDARRVPYGSMPRGKHNSQPYTVCNDGLPTRCVSWL